jgi:hypothetical protein
MISTTVRRVNHLITYVGAANAGSSSNTSTPITQPTGTKAGDVGFLTTTTQSAVANIPSGWTLLYSGIYFKVYGANEPTIALTWQTGTGYRQGQVYVLRGIRNAMPLMSSSSRTSTSTLTFPANSVTPTENYLWLLSTISTRMGTASAYSAAINDAGFTNQFFAQAGNIGLGFGIKRIPQSGLNIATSAGTWTASATLQTGTNKLLLLRSA